MTEFPTWYLNGSKVVFPFRFLVKNFLTRSSNQEPDAHNRIDRFQLTPLTRHFNSYFSRQFQKEKSKSPSKFLTRTSLPFYFFVFAQWKKIRHSFHMFLMCEMHWIGEKNGQKGFLKRMQIPQKQVLKCFSGAKMASKWMQKWINIKKFSINQFCNSKKYSKNAKLQIQSMKQEGLGVFQGTFFDRWISQKGVASGCQIPEHRLKDH